MEIKYETSFTVTEITKYINLKEILDKVWLNINIFLVITFSEPEKIYTEQNQNVKSISLNWHIHFFFIGILSWIVSILAYQSHKNKKLKEQ